MSQPYPTFDLKAFSDAIVQLAAGAAPGVVSVHSHQSHASGFVWRSGLIVTADETLADEGEVIVTFAGGKTAPAAIAGRDHTTDVALLRIDDGADHGAVSFSTAETAAGSLVVTVGSDNGDPVVGSGLVTVSAGPWRSMRGGDVDRRIELDMRLRRVAEGGVAIDASGLAIGMAVRGPQRTLVIPSATIDRVAAKLASDGRIARGYLGLALQPVRVGGGAGAIVMGVEKNGPGAAADMRQGDVIVAWNGKPLADVRSISRALGPDSVGTVVELSILRAGNPSAARITIGERPAA
ncbi:S1C family serine protease [Bradyrhizobium sp. LHD-71]|uniref:S1C family serine protease n=1 Tax=Bradyrhizobium sp. LHD-71 TaxID=3072141 RepID=UPI00280F48C6|nr:S1C family serine protease [Bradyrhizobium sp. LHD-71]MDQ8730051.1 S1C family serine protease [Bradyrhizobium sp. LHD-71]